MISRFAKTKPSLLQTAVRSFAQDLEKTITHLNAYHKNQGAKMVEFAGFEMPILFPGEHGGVMKEHLFTRKSCGVFDVSHMGQLHITGKDAAKFLERLTVVDTQALAHGQASLSVIMNEKGGIKDDCIITKVNDTHFSFNGHLDFAHYIHSSMDNKKPAALHPQRFVTHSHPRLM